MQSIDRCNVVRGGVLCLSLLPYCHHILTYSTTNNSTNSSNSSNSTSSCSSCSSSIILVIVWYGAIEVHQPLLFLPSEGGDLIKYSICVPHKSDLE